MSITSVHSELYQIPLPEVLMDATHGEMRYFSLVIARIRTELGEEGIGYTYTVGKAGSTATRAMIHDDLAPILSGADPLQNEFLWERMWWRLHYVGRGGIASFAMAAVDIALWDLKCKLAGEPLWRMLGGHSNRAQVYAGGIDLHLPLDELARKTDATLDRGIRAIKMKVGRDRLQEDVDRVEAMRKLIGTEFPLMVDANMRWTVEESIRACRAFREFGLYWIEEPTIPDDLIGYRRIMKEGGTPIAVGENYHTIYEFQKAISAAALSYPEVDVSNIGGITPWLKVAHLAEAHNLPVTTHGVHELHVHLLGAIPNASLLEAHGFGLEKYIQDPIKIDDGWAIAPDRPGHGVEFLWDKLEPHRTR